MNFLPISINIENESILIIGGGQLAIHKVETLERFTRNITIVAEEVHPDIRERGFINVIEKSYDADVLKDYLIVYAATDDSDLNSQIRQDGKHYRSIVNVVDKPDECDFVSPAIFKKDNMTVAVSSNGENVYAAIRWRNRIEELVEDGSIKAPKSKKRCREIFY